MSFQEIKVGPLRQIAESLVGKEDANACHNKAELIALLADEGVTYEFYKQWAGADAAEEEPKQVVVSSQKDTVLKMTRQNFSYEIRGHRFTKDNPFAVVPEDVAQEILDEDDGFRLASPREVSEYYN